MLFKGKRTFDSMMNAIALHLSSGDWEQAEEGDDADILFGPEWTGRTLVNKHGHVEGIELFHDDYTDAELLIVEKAISLLEGVEWGKAAPIVEEVRRPRRRPERERDAERGGAEE